MKSKPAKSATPSAPVVLSASDLRAALALAQSAARGVLAITEGVHQSVRSALALPSGAEPDRTGGWTGRVYAALHSINTGVGSGLQRAFTLLEDRLQQQPDAEPHPSRLAMLAVINGVMGDHLHAERNPLALKMQLRAFGQPLERAIAADASAFSAHALVLVHGLCMNDLQWANAADPGHGAALAEAHGCTPVYVRYNSGQPIAENGRELAGALEQLQRTWPVPLQRISVLGHSMGGLVARSAEHHASRDRMPWRGLLSDLLMIGCPHLGSPLERAGFGVDRLLESLPYARHFARLGQLRSTGITDLRHGHVTADATLLPLPAGVRCRAIAGVLARQRSPLAERLLGDGLVPLHSALGHAEDAAHSLQFAKGSTAVLYATGHLDLLRSTTARHRLIGWLS